MKVVYKGCTYRTENLTSEQKELMKKEIQKAEERENQLRDLKNPKTEPEKKGKIYKNPESE